MSKDQNGFAIANAIKNRAGINFPNITSNEDLQKFGDKIRFETGQEARFFETLTNVVGATVISKALEVLPH